MSSSTRPDPHHEPERWKGSDIAAPAGFGPLPPDATKSPNYALWLFYLYFRPRTFFREFVVEHLWFTTVVAALLFGISSAIDRVESELLKNSQRSSTQFAIQSWETYFAIILAAGTFAAALYFLIGGWWYRVRLKWSGAQNPDRTLARRVYVYASTVHALPTVLLTIWEAANYPTPLDAFNAPGSWWHMLIMVFPFWSIAVSYIGVRTVFNVRGFKGALWFLILPGLIYFVAVAALIVAFAMLTSASAIGPPQVSTPHRFVTPGVSFSLPGDWNVEKGDPDYHPDSYIPITTPQDGFLMIYLHNGEGESPKAVVGSSIAVSRDIDQNLVLGPEFTEWGTFSGHGRELTFSSDGEPFTARVFSAVLPDGRILHIKEYFVPDSRDMMRPGFDQVANSLTIKPKPTEAPE